MLLNLKNKYIPTVIVKSDSNNPWFSERLKSLLNRIKRLYRTASCSNNLQTWEKYQLNVTTYLNELKDTKDKFYSSELLSILQSNPNKFWCLLFTKSHTNTIDLVNADGEPIKSEQCATALNNSFLSMFCSLRSPFVESAPNFLLN